MRAAWREGTWIKPALAGVGIGLWMCAYAWESADQYREKLAALRVVEHSQPFRQMAAGVDADVTAVRNCESLLTAPASQRGHAEAAHRACLKAALQGTRSTIGAVALSDMAVKWLRDHPSDREIQEAGQAAIESGWRNAEILYQWRATMAAAADEHDNTWVLRTIFGRVRPGLSGVGPYEASLNLSELSLAAPEVLSRQRKRARVRESRGGSRASSAIARSSGV